MTAIVRHSLVMTTPDDPAYENKPSDWNADHVLSGLVAPDQGGTGVDFSASTGWIKVAAGTFSANASIPSGDISGLGTMATQNANNVAITGGTITGISALSGASGSLVASAPVSWTQTWNNAAVTFKGLSLVITDTASAAGSLAIEVLGGAAGATSLLTVSKGGLVSGGDGSTIGGISNSAFLRDVGGAGQLGVSNTGVLTITSSQLKMQDGSAASPAYSFGNVTTVGLWDPLVADTLGIAGNGFAYGKNGVGGATTRFNFQKSVTGIADNTATATFTVTVPNAAHSASLSVRLVGSLGAGGAIGAGEATGTISYDFAIARTSGVATVVFPSVAYGSATSSVAGAASITISAAASTISGGNGATQTFTVDVTIAKGSGSSANHTCLCYGELLNANASGVTIA